MIYIFLDEITPRDKRTVVLRILVLVYLVSARDSDYHIE